MKINLEVTFANGSTVEANCSAPEIVKFEDKFDISISNAARDLRVSHLLFLAYSWAKRTKQTELSFDEWTETVENISTVEVPKSKG
jgi:hypothetical protein